MPEIGSGTEDAAIPSIIPLIRAAVVVPWVAWLERNGVSPDARLDEVDLGYLPVEDPNLPVPLINVFAFARRMSELEGPDIGCRVTSKSTIEDLANIGMVMLHGDTPRGAFQRTALALPRHCTHEVMEVEDTGDGIIVRDIWQGEFDAETLHAVHQNVASIIQCVCARTALERPYFEYIRLIAHPLHGLEHLSKHFDCPLLSTTRQPLEVKIPYAVADAPLKEGISAVPPELPSPDNWTRLRDDGTLSASVRVAISMMLRSGAPSVKQLAYSAGMSPRTLQRRLRREGTEFSQLLDGVRREIATDTLAAGTTDVATLSTELGYSHPAAFARAVRRWTGSPPRDLRKNTRSRA